MIKQMAVTYGISLGKEEEVYFNGEHQVTFPNQGEERTFYLNKDGVMEIRVKGGTSIWYFVKHNTRFSFCTSYSFETEIEKLAYIGKYCHAPKS